MAENDNTEPLVLRLGEFLSHMGMNPYQLASSLGYDSSEKIHRLFRKQGAKPSADIISDISNKFEQLNLDWWITGKGTMIREGSPPGTEPLNNNLPKIVVTNDNGAEQIVMMDSKAAAGFPAHINDRDFYSRLPTLKIPKLTEKQGTFICVQITGDSMEPTIQHDQWVVAKFIEDIETNIRGGDICLVVTNDGVICKRVYPDKKTGAIECVSDNDDYRAFELMASEYLQVYKYACDINFNPSNKNSDLRNEVKKLNKRITNIEKNLKL